LKKSCILYVAQKHPCTKISITNLKEFKVKGMLLNFFYVILKIACFQKPKFLKLLSSVGHSFTKKI